ncbi:MULTISPECIES: dihydrolipoamide acetyltransferase family protein [Natronospira]|uniref:Dihydrolipoamide acetyltransferase component of pyruvate dehydrogenase complex n=1 Tax=Natronospira bacteriovora TaxID=3069753 RepID=A0ABU0W4S2_9GAMM|nr:dihydrolipoamide acetyltransferase family protein [Natronospira sp. AB-CW4]MDQ2069027.1 dihydrolipoamide acetyltransferase family protein [Natronospira sp. AB-CW4]
MSDFRMPSMGADMESGKLVRWKIRPGDRVKRGQVVAAVETAKAVLDIEIFEDGTVRELLVEEGSEVPVGEVLARIDGDEQAASKTAEAATAPLPRKAAPERPSPDDSQPPRKPAQPTRHGPGHEPRPTASPAARRQARLRDLDLSRLRGSGPDGAILLRDLDQTDDRTFAEPSRGFEPEAMRSAIAATMSRAKREIPHFYLSQQVDLNAAEQWLENWNHDRPPAERLLMAGLFIRATALALARFGELNGHYGPDGFRPSSDIHLGLAIHLRGGGLVAPAILHADRLSLGEITAAMQDLVQRARRGGLRGSEFNQGTATVTSLGERGVDRVIGVIQPPQVAMIGFGRPRPRPVAIDDALAVHATVDISLAADHRVCDGHVGARFLNDIDQRLQHPEGL